MNLYTKKMRLVMEAIERQLADAAVDEHALKAARVLNWMIPMLPQNKCKRIAILQIFLRGAFENWKEGGEE